MEAEQREQLIARSVQQIERSLAAYRAKGDVGHLIDSTRTLEIVVSHVNNPRPLFSFVDQELINEHNLIPRYYEGSVKGTEVVIRADTRVEAVSKAQALDPFCMVDPEPISLGKRNFLIERGCTLIR